MVLYLRKFTRISCPHDNINISGTREIYQKSKAWYLREIQASKATDQEKRVGDRQSFLPRKGANPLRIGCFHEWREGEGGVMSSGYVSSSAETSSVPCRRRNKDK